MGPALHGRHPSIRLADMPPNISIHMLVNAKKGEKKNYIYGDNLRVEYQRSRSRIAWLERVFFKLRACRVPTMTVNGYEVLWFRQERTTHCISGISFMDVTIRHIFHVSVRHICYPCISGISSMFLGWGLNYMGETGLLHLLTRCQTFQFKISSWEIDLAWDV